ncbi:MAG TPA: hypothetical protein VND94_11970 [Terriglobia bacterium]|nr:hypothetical protein [Terriglobia bacterium]
MSSEENRTGSAFGFRQGIIVLLLAASVALGACQAPATNRLPGAPAQPLAQLAASEVDYLPAGTVLLWRNLNSGEVMEEHVAQHAGGLYNAYIGTHHSFYYVPDPLADNENTEVADMNGLFPLRVGNKVMFNRHPKAGKMIDTVEVVRAETLQLPLGAVDTFVIDSESRLIEGNWIANAAVWYAPALHCVVQIEIKDTDGDDRRRQLIEIRKPQA